MPRAEGIKLASRAGRFVQRDDAALCTTFAGYRWRSGAAGSETDVERRHGATEKIVPQTLPPQPEPPPGYVAPIAMVAEKS